MPVISVIIPVYNAEKYLRTAIDSVLNQSYSFFELILIDDASTDTSLDICKNYADKDERIHVLKNESKIHGPGMARNIGLDYAEGEFLYFMDADDWIEPDLFQKTIQRMRETNASIAQFSIINEYSDEGNSEKVYIWKGKEIFTQNDIKEEFYSFWGNNRFSLWNHIFRKEIIKKVRFENLLSGEDISFVMDALSNSNKIVYIPDVFYHYRITEDSISHKWIENAVECRCIIWKHQKKFLDSLQEKGESKIYAEVAFDTYIWIIYQLCSRCCPLTYKEKVIKLRMATKEMNMKKYRNQCDLKKHKGIQKLKYIAVKCYMEKLILLIGPIFLKIVRGE